MAMPSERRRSRCWPRCVGGRAPGAARSAPTKAMTRGTSWRRCATRDAARRAKRDTSRGQRDRCADRPARQLCAEPTRAATDRARLGWLKTIAWLRKVKLRGLAKVDGLFVFACAAFNLRRLPRLLAR